MTRGDQDYFKDASRLHSKNMMALRSFSQPEASEGEVHSWNNSRSQSLYDHRKTNLNLNREAESQLCGNCRQGVKDVYSTSGGERSEHFGDSWGRNHGEENIGNGRKASQWNKYGNHTSDSLHNDRNIFYTGNTSSRSNSDKFGYASNTSQYISSIPHPNIPKAYTPAQNDKWNQHHNVHTKKSPNGSVKQNNSQKQSSSISRKNLKSEKHTTSTSSVKSKRTDSRPSSVDDDIFLAFRNHGGNSRVCTKKRLTLIVGAVVVVLVVMMIVAAVVITSVMGNKGKHI